MDNQIPLDIPQDDDEISFWDIVNFLKDPWFWLAGGMVLSLGGAVGFMGLWPAQYEAGSNVKPATVEMPATTATRGAEFEAVAQLEKRATLSAESTSLLMLKTLAKREEIVRLQMLLVEQKVQLSAPMTQPMQLLEPIYAPERAVAPEKMPVLAGGLLGGLVLGGLVFLCGGVGWRVKPVDLMRVEMSPPPGGFLE